MVSSRFFANDKSSQYYHSITYLIGEQARPDGIAGAELYSYLSWLCHPREAVAPRVIQPIDVRIVSLAPASTQKAVHTAETWSTLIPWRRDRKT